MDRAVVEVKKVEVSFADYTGYGTAKIFEHVNVLITDSIVAIEPSDKHNSTITDISYAESTQTTKPWPTDYNSMIFPLANVMHVYVEEYATRDFVGDISEQSEKFLSLYYEEFEDDGYNTKIVDEYGAEVTEFEDGDILVLAAMPYDWHDSENKWHHATGEAEYHGGKWYKIFQ